SDIVWSLFLILREHVEYEPGETALVRARLRQSRHVGRRDTVHRLRGKLIGEWRWEIIGQAAGALGGLPLVVKIRDLGLGRDSRRLCFAEAGTARLREIAEGKHRHRMTDRADFLVDLEAAL